MLTSVNAAVSTAASSTPLSKIRYGETKLVREFSKFFAANLFTRGEKILVSQLMQPYKAAICSYVDHDRQNMA